MNKKLAFWFACSGMALCYASEHHELIMHKKIGIFSTINTRPNQEDFFYYGDVDGGKLYAVYDGHYCHKVDDHVECDGSAVAKFLAEKFPIYFSQTSGTVRDRMMAAFTNADNDEFVKTHKECGSTAAVVFVKDNIAHIAHVGNSRALLEYGGTLKFVTRDHLPNRADEYLRIEGANGLIFNKRVNGFLLVSRAFGDYGLDKRLIIAEPEYEEIPLTEKNKFLVLATDGLWKTMGNDEVIKILHGRQSSIQDMGSLAKLLALFAIKRGSRDNITIMLVDLLS